jgi:histidinol-phosphate aminotransferase
LWVVEAISFAVGAGGMRERASKNECAEKVKATRAKLAVALKQLGFRL